MGKTIIQKIIFKKATAKTLYELYMSAKLHSLIIGGPVTISQKVGARFRAFDGYITGKNLQLVKNELIVQSWRGSDWNAKAKDSTFLISFEQKGPDALINVVHANVPDKAVSSLDKGWHDHYWKPWKQWLAGKQITRPVM
jgi:activator of HSP90 ATPase